MSATSSSSIRRLCEAAEAASRDGDLGRAIACYRELAELVPSPAVLNNLGLVLARDGQLEAAVAVFGCALAAERPTSAAVFVNLGNALRRLGRRAEAVAAYEQAIAVEPTSAAAHFNAHAALYDAAAPERALTALERASSLRPHHADTRFYLGALRRLHGRDDPTLEAELPPECEFLVSSLRHAQAHRVAATRLFADTFELLRFALSCAPPEGLLLELGVRRGTTVRFLASACPEGSVHGFDSFEGLPSAWGDQPAGLYSTRGELPEVPDNVTLHPGWFADTLPSFVASLEEPVRFVHVDCDLYASTRAALAPLKPHLCRGAVLVFDEYLCNPGWEQEEHRALLELDLPFTYLAFSLFTKQAAVRLL